MPEEEAAFQVSLADFSGPLDMLCALVENRSIDAAAVRLTDVLSQYVSYLVRSRKATLSELADFFSLASRLVLRKVRALFPSADDEEPAADADDYDGGEDEPDEETLAAMLERFKPYRKAAAILAEMKDKRERSFVRICDDAGPPWFDIGDLYSLSSHWWRLMESRTQPRGDGNDYETAFFDEIPDAAPEELLVERQMDEIMSFLGKCPAATLRGLIGEFGRGELTVTLLALLELSRLGRVRLVQGEAWGDVSVCAA
ncbi:segregation/condensation protein A [Synergistales bacterium]|nr:segregation/condensation protein A [Synergistales bacterium]